MTMAICDATGHDYGCNCPTCLTHWRNSDRQVEAAEGKDA